MQLAVEGQVFSDKIQRSLQLGIDHYPVILPEFCQKLGGRRGVIGVLERMSIRYYRMKWVKYVSLLIE